MSKATDDFKVRSKSRMDREKARSAYKLLVHAQTIVNELMENSPASTDIQSSINWVNWYIAERAVREIKFKGE